MWGPLKFLQAIRLELTVFSYMFVSNVAMSATMLLVIQKVCYPEGSPGASVPCDKTDILKQTSYMSSTLTYLKDFLPGILVLVAGSWRDYSGRSRPLLLVGLAGEILSTTFSLISTIYWGLSAWLTVIVDGIIPGLTGNMHIFMLACISNAAENSTENHRTSKMAFTYVSVMGGLCVSLASSGFILNALGFTGFYTLMIALYLCVVALSVTIVKDHPKEDRSGGVLASVKRLKLIFRPRPNGHVLWLMIVASCAVSSILRCEGTVTTQFLQKVMKITPQEQGLASFTKLFMSLIAGAALTPLLTQYFKMSEFLVAILCTIPSSVAALCLSFSKTLAELYIYSAMDFTRIMLVAILWSLVTKSVKQSELGVYSGFLTFGGALFPAALNPLYLYVFNKTYDVFPGAFFLLSGGILLLTGVLIAISWWYYDPKLLPKPEEEVNKEMKEPGSKEELKV